MTVSDLKGTNWRTTAAGGLCMAMALANIFGIQVPGFSAEPGTLLTLGFGLLFAKDAAAR